MSFSVRWKVDYWADFLLSESGFEPALVKYICESTVSGRAFREVAQVNEIKLLLVGNDVIRERFKYRLCTMVIYDNVEIIRYLNTPNRTDNTTLLFCRVDEPRGNT